MAYIDGNATDQNGLAVAGALVYVYDRNDGGLADLTDALDQPITNPVTTDEDGYWQAYVETDRYYTAKYFWGGRVRYTEAGILAGDPPIGPNSDPNLRMDLLDPDDGATHVAYRGRSVKSKLDDWRTPLDVGISGVGEGNAVQDTLALDAVMAVGKHLIVPLGLDLISDTEQGHLYSADRQIVEINGSITHTGTRHTILDEFYYGFFGLFTAFEKEGIQLLGGGKLDGAWDSGDLLAGDQGSAIYMSNCHQPRIDMALLTNFVDDAIKTYSCSEVDFKATIDLVRNIGLELRSYATNPYTVFGANAPALSAAWTGTIYGPSGKVDVTCKRIDDGLHGAGNGTGVDFSTVSGGPRINNLRVRATILDCLLGVWSENNDPGDEAFNIDVWLNVLGNIAGAATIECSDGAGFIGVQGLKVKGSIRNQTNIAPPGGAETVGVNFVNCSDVEAQVWVETDTGIANRMQHAFKLSGADDVDLRLSGQSGVSSDPILYDPGIGAECTNIRVEGFRGGGTHHTWSAPTAYTFSLANVPVDDTNPLLTGAVASSRHLAAPGRVVGVSATTTGDTPTGNFSIEVEVDGIPQTDVAIDQADFTADTAHVAIDAADALQAEAGADLSVFITTDASWTVGYGITVDVLVDHGMKV